MTYPPVTQFETRAFEAEAQARLARERRAARAPKRTTNRGPRLMEWLPFPRPAGRAAERAPLLRSRLRDCEQ
jgi:hypothetical protein